MERAKVGTCHFFRKSYFVTCREALFSWNPDMLAKVKRVLAQEEGISESVLDSHLYHNGKLRSKRLNIIIFPPSLIR